MGRVSIYELESRLFDGYVRRLEPFRALLDFELHLVTFVQGFESLAGDRSEMHENIFASSA